VEERLDRRRDRGHVLGVEEQGRVARDLRQAAAVRAGDRHAARHRLEHRQPEALVERRHHEAGGERIEALEVLVRDPAEQADVVREPERHHARLEVVLV
jgi:hypothetical protein